MVREFTGLHDMLARLEAAGAGLVPPRGGAGGTAASFDGL